MMHDVLIIKSQIETIRHNNKSTSMTTEEWRSLDQIARSTIRMHLAENVYFNIAKEKIAFALWEKLSSMYEKKSSSSKLILIRQLFNMKIRETGPTTSHINTFSQVLTELSSQGLNFKEEINCVEHFPTCQEAREKCKWLTNNSLTLMQDEAIRAVVSKEFRRKSMSLTIDDSFEAQFSEGMDQRMAEIRVGRGGETICNS